MLLLDSIKKISRALKGILTPKSLLLQLLHGSYLLEKLHQMMSAKSEIILIYVDIVDFHQVVQLSGDNIARKVLNLLHEALKHRTAQITNCSGEIVVENLWGDDFLIILQQETSISKEQLIKMATALRITLEENLKLDLIKLTGNSLKLHIGCSIINCCNNKTPEQALYNALKEAQRVAKGTWSQQTVHLLGEFNDLLEKKDFRILYQPIVSLQTGEVLGWEALTRGPKDSAFFSPAVIFNFAEEVGCLFPLEKICRELAINNFGQVNEFQKLFLNIHPYTVNDPQFVKGETRKLLDDGKVSPNNVVFEITERHSINDFSQFNKTLSHYRGQGYQVAVDDAGAGFSSLQTIAEIRPEYIKIDASLVRDISTNRVKRALLETFVTFAQKIGCRIIAEGIETEKELATLCSIGVHYGQGYFLARPAFPKPNLSSQALKKIILLSRRSPSGVWQKDFPIGEICKPAIEVNINTSVRELKEIFDANDPLSGVVVTDFGRPVGLIMRQHLDRYLGTQYGVALYFERPVSVVMDRGPLMVDASTPLEQVSQQAMGRNENKLYDNVLVIKENALFGIVSVQSLLDTLTRIRVEVAKGTNPLTFLPGNNSIEKEMHNRITEQRDFACIYLDLDNFKSYNDRYGFEQGDRLILMAARLLTGTVQKFGTHTDFVGHIGGDDFIVFTEKHCAEIVCQRYIRYFDHLVKGLVSPKDKQLGGFYGQDRQGRKMWFPLVSVSMAIVDYEGGCSSEEFVKNAVQLKNYTKTKKGSIYVRNNRDCLPLG
ncbi:GGDEF domain-containing protein [Desulfotomaculum sp. 1211_IL3151]|uniref:GGDEF domain-containing protein n=1 Tax=Desulfotomaculum sp. 1211_IL3151 TaxID=3084055 RepID=UPI002FDA4099